MNTFFAAEAFEKRANALSLPARGVTALPHLPAEKIHNAVPVQAPRLPAAPVTGVGTPKAAPGPKIIDAQFEHVQPAALPAPVGAQRNTPTHMTATSAPRPATAVAPTPPTPAAATPEPWKMPGWALSAAGGAGGALAANALFGGHDKDR